MEFMGQRVFHSHGYFQSAPWKFFIDKFLSLKSKIVAFKLVTIYVKTSWQTSQSLASQSGTKCRLKWLLAFLSLLSPPYSISLFHFYCAHSMWILVSIFKKKSNGAVKLKDFLCFRMG